MPPFYEYICKKCGIVEAEQKITEEALKKCPCCNTEDVKRIISKTSFGLKGSCWSRDGYSNKKNK